MALALQQPCCCGWTSLISQRKISPKEVKFQVECTLPLVSGTKQVQGLNGPRTVCLFSHVQRDIFHKQDWRLSTIFTRWPCCAGTSNRAANLVGLHYDLLSILEPCPIHFFEATQQLGRGMPAYLNRFRWSATVTSLKDAFTIFKRLHHWQADVRLQRRHLYTAMSAHLTPGIT